jgi:hypothetical protein
MANVSIDRGRIIVYRIFDIAEEIDIGAVQELVKSTHGSSRLAMARSIGHALVIRNAPITLTLAAAPVRLGGQSMAAERFARIWDYGVISMQFHLPIRAGTTWEELVRLAALAEDDNDFDELARQGARELVSIFAAATKSPHDPRSIEDYIVYLLERLDGVQTPAELLSAVDVPALILGEPVEKISSKVRSAILENVHAYSERDLAVVDWNSALVVEPEGSHDVVDILEFAVTHLMEFRYFDDLLDERLERLYDSLEHRHSVWSFFRNDYERLSREAGSFYLEFSDYVERVENSVKFVGDFYLATIFRSAVRRFNLPEWEASLNRKLNALAQISAMLQGEVNARRSHWLEVIVVILILVELLSTILRLA